MSKLNKFLSVLAIFALTISFGLVSAYAHTDSTSDIDLQCEVTSSTVPTDTEENFISWWWCYRGIDENTSGEYEELEELEGKFSLSAEIRTEPTEGDLEEGFIPRTVSGEISTKDIDRDNPLNGVCQTETAAEAEGDPLDCDAFMGSTDDWANCHVEDVDLYNVIREDSSNEELEEVAEDAEAGAFSGEVIFSGDVKPLHKGKNERSNGNNSSNGRGSGTDHSKAIVDCTID